MDIDGEDNSDNDGDDPDCANQRPLESICPDMSKKQVECVWERLSAAILNAAAAPLEKQRDASTSRFRQIFSSGNLSFAYNQVNLNGSVCQNKAFSLMTGDLPGM
jgi:hypothetical protein